MILIVTLLGLLPSAIASDNPTQEEDFGPALISGGLRPDAVAPEEFDIDEFIGQIMRGSDHHAQWFRDLERVKTTRKERHRLDYRHDGATTYGRAAYDMMLARLLDPTWIRSREPNARHDAIVFCHAAHIPAEDWDREARKWVGRYARNEIYHDDWKAMLHFIKYAHPSLEPHENCSCPPIP